MTISIRCVFDDVLQVYYIVFYNDFFSAPCPRIRINSSVSNPTVDLITKFRYDIQENTFPNARTVYINTDEHNPIHLFYDEDDNIWVIQPFHISKGTMYAYTRSDAKYAQDITSEWVLPLDDNQTVYLNINCAGR